LNRHVPSSLVERYFWKYVGPVTVHVPPTVTSRLAPGSQVYSSQTYCWIEMVVVASVADARLRPNVRLPFGRSTLQPDSKTGSPMYSLPGVFRFCRFADTHAPP
jgi:hypothetical protein